MNCTRCKAQMMTGTLGGRYCPNDCDRIPEVLDGGGETDALIDTQGVTLPFVKADELCCTSPELAPFELRNGQMGHHCWSCGKVFQ